eukprot:364915-Chlamydomonas_euryale.AAC.10
MASLNSTPLGYHNTPPQKKCKQCIAPTTARASTRGAHIHCIHCMHLLTSQRSIRQRLQNHCFVAAGVACLGCKSSAAVAHRPGSQPVGIL